MRVFFEIPTFAVSWPDVLKSAAGSHGWAAYACTLSEQIDTSEVAHVMDVTTQDAGNPQADGTTPTVAADFAEILCAAEHFKMDIDGGSTYSPKTSSILEKKTRSQLAACTGYEHICLSILGIARLQQIQPEIEKLNNGRMYMQNPGTQLMEQECGFTMHADRIGTSVTIREAPGIFLNAFRLSTQLGRQREFFDRCFDRRHDPCLEGRVGLVVEFLEQLSITNVQT